MDSSPIQRQHIEDLYPLTPLQQGLLFTSLHEAKEGLYHMQMVVELEGELRPADLAAAFRGAARRHGALRTVFSWRRLDQPRQAVLKAEAAPLAVRWIELSEAAGQGPWHALLAADRRRGLRIDRAPLARVTVVRRGPRRAVVLWSFHHLILDGWSAARVLADVLRLYASGGNPDSLGLSPPLFRQYLEWLDRRDGATDEAWWKRHLEGFEVPTPLPGARRRRGPAERLGPRPDGALPNDARIDDARDLRWRQTHHRLPPDAVAALTPALGAAGLTAAAAVQGLWMLLLARFGGVTDVCAGATVAGRPADLPGSQEMVGLLIQTLPLRAMASPGQRAVPWLQALQLEQAEARERGALPLTRLRELSALPPGSPLFESLVIFESYPVEAALGQAPPGLKVKSARLVERIEYPLSLLAVPRGGSLALELLWDEERVDAAVAAVLPRRLEALLESLAKAMATGAEVTLGELSVLTEGEGQQLLAAGGGPELRPLPGVPRRLDEILEWAAGERSGAVALTGANALAGKGDLVALTYAQTEARVAALASALEGAGVAVGDTVAVALARTVALPLALLAVYRAGAVVVPLDAHQPASRRRLILEAAGARWLLADGASQEQLGGDFPPALEVLDLESLWDPAAGPGGEISHRADGSASSRRSAGSGDPATLAYRIFTSGSTGVPKGVEVSHGAALAFLASVAAALPLGPDDTLAAVTTAAFDISVLELFLPLAVGARVEVMTAAEASDGEALARRLEDCGATALQATPATWRLLRAAGWHPPTDFLALCGGEALPPALAGDLLDAGARLWNLYGPTETTVWSAAGAVTVADAQGSRVPVGKALAGERLAVLDASFEPLPPAARGQLWIAGEGLARGYAQAPGATAEAFRPHPFPRHPGERLYRTGDRARWRADGRLEIAGRVDAQIKLRGFRIEPGEIEATLERHPAVTAAAVLLRHGDDSKASAGSAESDGEPYLVAFLSLSEARSETLTAVRAAAAAALPNYMVPTAWEVIDELPLGASGKTDRQTLARRPAPRSGSGAGAADAPSAPANPLEAAIAEVWADVLERSALGAHEDVFTAGAHSLSALQAAARLRKVLDVEVDVGDLFEAPTAAALARRMMPRLGPPRAPSLEDASDGTSGEDGGGAADSLIPRLAPGEVAPLSSSQLRQWFLDQLEPGLAAYNLPTAVRLTGRVEIPALEEALAAVVERHEVLRTVYPARDGEPVTRVLATGPVPLPVVDLRPPGGGDADDEGVRQRLGAEMTAPFDLVVGPILRASLLRLGEERWIFHLTLHHIAGDGWTLGVLLREVLTLYRAAVEGAPLAEALDPLPLQYGDYAAWQGSRASSAAAAHALEWWTQHLDGGSPPLELPVDRPRPAVQTFRGARAPWRLPSPLTAALTAHGRRRGATLFMLLATALNTLFLRLTDARDLTLGTFTANRLRPELEPLAGFFVNTLPLRVTLEAEEDGSTPHFDGALARVRRSALGVFAHQEVSFETLLEALDLRRDLARTPLFQAMLVVQNLPVTGALERLRVPGLELEVVEFTGLGRSNFDLTLWVTEVGGASGSVGGALEYNRDLIEASTAERWLGHLQTLLAAALEDPRRPLEALPLLRAAERSAVVERWPQPTPRSVEPLPVHELLRLRALEQPTASAVETTDGGRWSYGELQARVVALAARLRQQGVEPEAPVAVYLERSPEAIVALLATLRCGGAYVPLDPSAPPDRLAYQVMDSGAAVLLTSRDLAASAPSAAVTLVVEEVLVAEDLESVSESAAAAREAAAASGERAAYVLYTSGTTGRPKGVVVSHHNLSNYAQSAAADYGFGPGQRLLQFAALSFDNSGEEIYGALTSGATLVLRDEAMVASPEAFLAAVERLRISVVNLPTAFWHEVVVALEERPLPSVVRVVIVGGETMGPQRLAQWWQRATAATELYNTYGPTEATIGITAWRALAEPRGEGGFRLRGDDGGLRSVPLGRPMANGRLYVLEATGTPAPPGVPGQLYAGGPGITRGYLGRPGLTAERFVPDPFSGEAGARLYATGDRARWLSTGDLAFLGRVDHQVKVRGFRIELGEIEAALSALPGVTEAVVQMRRDGAANARLAAFVGGPSETAPGPGAAALVSELRGALQERLPPYMVPDALVVLPSLPRLPSGKLHVAGLPEPSFEREALGTEYVAPRGEMEELMAQLFAEVLGVERVGAFDDFFALGGHSLLATRLTSRLTASFESELPVRLLFEASTPARLALAVEEHLIAELEALEV